MPTSTTRPSTVVSIRLSAKDADILTAAAKAERVTLSEYIREAAEDRVEDTLDLVRLKRQLAYLKHHPEHIHPFEELEAKYADI